MIQISSAVRNQAGRFVRWSARGLGRSPRPTPGGRLDRLVAAASRRTTPRHAATVFVVVTALTATALVAVALGPSHSPTGQHKFTRAAAQPTAPEQSADPSAVREVPRPGAAAPELSPPADGSGSGAEGRSGAGSGDEPPTGDFVGWAILDRSTGAVTGSDTLTETSTTASMIKAWLVADYLRRTDEAGEQPSQSRLDELTLIIRDSHNEYAQALFEELGRHASIERLIVRCGLTDSYAIPNYWSNTRLSARDTARMGACLADGRGAGNAWTGWLLDEMRAVRGVGDFGIRHAFPPGQQGSIAIKNGWVVRSDEGAWHVNCLAIGDGWTMGVLSRYPAHLGYEHGAEICRSLAAQHLR